MTPGERARSAFRGGVGWVEATPPSPIRPWPWTKEQAAEAGAVPSVSFIVHGAPRTKKNHTRILRVRGRVVVAQSESHDAWANTAILQLRAKSHGLPAWIRGPVNLRARIYRERDTGDLGNYLAAICDALQAAGVVTDDREILGFDGSRLLKDAKNPRVDIVLTPLED